MLLAIDIGNTDFTIGVFQGKKLCDTFRMRTKINVLLMNMECLY